VRAAATAPRLVPVRLRDLIIGQEFTTTLTRRHGVVSGTGWVPWDDGTGRTVRLRAVLIRYDCGAERIHVAETAVLVASDTEHRRFTADEQERRWCEQLHEPGSMAKLSEFARLKPVGRPC
jgi:hypothetical protein